MIYQNLVVIGTSHIAKQSIQDIEKTVEKEKPEIIAVELDKKRYYALTHDVKRKVRLRDIIKIGFKGYLFNVIGAWAEKKLGNIVGVAPGSDMLKAIELAKKNKARIALIDQDIEITLKRLSKSLTWKEKFTFFGDFLRGIFFRKKVLKEIGIKHLDLTKVPPKSLIKKLIGIVKKKYPNVYMVLVEERNKIMAKNLSNIIRKHPDTKILAVVGAGHEEEIIKLIKEDFGVVSYSFKVEV